MLANFKKSFIGLAIIFILLAVSATYSFWAPDEYGKDNIHYNQNGEVVGRAPFPPSLKHPFGTDISGYDVFLQMMDGAKFTIVSAVTVSIFRVLLGTVIGVILSLWLPRLIPILKDFLLPFQYIPTLFITAALMVPVAPFTGLPMTKVITYQLLVCIFVALPTLLFYTTELLDEWKQSSFVQSSYLMGASHFHVLRKHYLPYLKSYGLLMIVQQFFHTLVLLMHLSVFTFFLGGQSQSGQFSGDPDTFLPSSLSNEWAGLIGQNILQITRAPWIVLSSVLGFFLLLALANMMKKEMEDHLSQSNIRKRKRKKPIEAEPMTSAINSDAFTFIEK